MRSNTPLFLIITILCTWAANTVHAQTAFYLSEIAVSPAAPTEQDNIQLQLIGELASTGTSISSASAAVNGYTVNVMIATYTTWGFAVMVPHTEIVDLGLLSAGTYTVNITGFGVDDLAPTEQHQFTVSGGGGGSECDSLQIASIRWAPFSDTALVVHVFNPSTTLFDYPGFVLLSAGGDTLASEAANLFGIGQESIHTLDVFPGTTMPASPFNATLHLWTNFYSEQACAWDLPVDLCPPDSCTPMLVRIANTGGGLALGSFTYAILATGIPIVSGSFTLTTDQQADADTVCLQPGEYVLQLLAQQEPTGGQLTYDVSSIAGYQGPSAAVSSTFENELAFTFYGPCMDPVQSIPELSDARLVISVESGVATLLRTDGMALGELRVMDIHGRLIASAKESSERHQFTTSDWAPGLYLVQMQKADGHVLTVRFVVE